MNEFAKLLKQSGLTTKSAAELLGYSYDGVVNWKYGRRNAPPEVLKKMRDCVKAHERVF